MTVKNKKNTEKIEKLIDETYAYMSYETDYLPTPVVFEGRISTIDPEVAQYYTGALNACGISSTEGNTIYRIDIDTTQTKLSMWLIFIAFLVFDIVAIIVLVSEIKYNKKVEQAASSVTYTAPTDDLIFGDMKSRAETTTTTSSKTDDNNNLYR